MGLRRWLTNRTPAPAPAEPRAVSMADLLGELLGAQGFGVIGLGDADACLAEATPDDALTASAVYAAVSVIASAIGTLPIHVRDRTTEEVLDHPLNAVFCRPNPDMTWPDVAEAFCLNLLTTGNGYAWVRRDAAFTPIGLYPLRSLQTWPVRRRGRVRFITRVMNAERELAPTAILHAKNMSWDGVVGVSPLRCGASAIGLSRELDNFAAKFFTNGANAGNAISLPENAKPEQVAEFQRQWREQYAGPANHHKTAIGAGLTVTPLGFSPRDSQAIEARKYQVLEVARIYQLPPHLIASLESATLSNIEEQSRQFAEQTLRRWVVKIEAALERVLLTEDEAPRVKIRINLDAMIRGTLKDRVEALTSATGGAPIFTQNEARAHLNLRPLPGGDELLTNLNQASAATRSRALLGSIARNMATKEAKAAQRAAKKHAGDAQGFAAWAEDFYTKHRQTLGEALEGAGVSAGELDGYCRHQREQITEAGRSGQIDGWIQSMEERAAAELIRCCSEGEKDDDHTDPGAQGPDGRRAAA